MLVVLLKRKLKHRPVKSYRGLRQEDGEFKTSLDHIVRPYLKVKKNKCGAEYI